MSEDKLYNVDVVEEWFIMPDGVEIFTKRWKSIIEPPIATIVFLHGFGDHVNRYSHVFAKFASKGIEAFGWDQRGFGKTAVRHKNRGQTGGWKVIAGDITTFLISNRRSGIPQFLFGHSMGGCIATMYAASGLERNKLAGVVLSSPLIAMAPQSRVSKPVVILGIVLSKAMPTLPIPINLDKKFISRNPKEIERYENDPLVHPLGCLRGLADLLNGSRLVFKGKYKNITQPIYITFGTGDGITDCNSARDLFQKLPSQDKTWREWPGFYHEMHYEDERDLVIDDYLSWVLRKATNSNSDSRNDIQFSAESTSAVSSSPLALASA